LARRQQPEEQRHEHDGNEGRPDLPPISVPIEWRLTEPAPVLVASGTEPQTTVLPAPASAAASTRLLPASSTRIQRLSMVHWRSP
jgi:hypothetical protein